MVAGSTPATPVLSCVRSSPAPNSHNVEFAFLAGGDLTRSFQNKPVADFPRFHFLWLMRKVIPCLLLLFVTAGSSSGQNIQRSLTFHPRPLEVTKNFLITEFGYDYRITQTGSFDNAENNNKNYHLAVDLGAMRNLSPKWALGATAYYSLDDSGSRLAIKPRLRRWLTPEQSIDLSAGPIIGNFGSYYGKSPGLAGHIGYSYRDWVMLSLGVEIIPINTVFGVGGSSETIVYKSTESTLYAGIRVGSYGGTACAILTPIIALIHFFATYES